MTLYQKPRLWLTLSMPESSGRQNSVLKARSWGIYTWMVSFFFFNTTQYLFQNDKFKQKVVCRQFKKPSNCKSKRSYRCAIIKGGLWGARLCVSINRNNLNLFQTFKILCNLRCHCRHLASDCCTWTEAISIRWRSQNAQLDFHLSSFDSEVFRKKKTQKTKKH